MAKYTVKKQRGYDGTFVFSVHNSDGWLFGSEDMRLAADELNTQAARIEALEQERDRLRAALSQIASNAPVSETQPDEQWEWAMWVAGNIASKALAADTTTGQPETESEPHFVVHRKRSADGTFHYMVFDSPEHDYDPRKEAQLHAELGQERDGLRDALELLHNMDYINEACDYLRTAEGEDVYPNYPELLAKLTLLMEDLNSE